MIELLVVVALILLNGFFAMSEMALMTSRKIRLKQMAEDPGHPSLGARKALASVGNFLTGGGIEGLSR